MAIYDALAAEYEHGMARITGIHAPDIVAALALEGGGRALDVAAGTGAVTEPLAGRVGPEGGVVAIDVARGMLGFARARLDGCACVRYTLASAEELPFGDASFDGAACGFGIQHMANADAALRELRRVLRPGGRCATAVWAEVGKDIKTPINEAFVAMSGQRLSPGQDSWAVQDALAARLRRAGFAPVDVRASTGNLRVADLDEWWHAVTSGRLGDRLRASGLERAARVREDAYRRAEGFGRRIAAGWEFPSAAIVAVGG